MFSAWIKNYPAAGENFLENVILKVSQTLFQGFLPQGGHTFFKGGGGGGGAVKYPELGAVIRLTLNPT